MPSAEQCAELAQCPAIANLTEVPLGKQPLIVILAYFTAFYPWTILPIIHSLMDPQPAPTLREIFSLFLVTLPPTGFIIHYIVLQAQIEEYNEMSAAIIATIVGVMEYVRIFTVTIAMFRFRRWTVDALKCLAVYGYLDDETANAPGMGPVILSANQMQEIEERVKLMLLNSSDFDGFFASSMRLAVRFIRSEASQISNLLRIFREFLSINSLLMSYHDDPEKVPIFWMVRFLSQHGRNWLHVEDGATEHSTTLRWQQKICTTSWASEALGMSSPPDMNNAESKTKMQNVLQAVLQSENILPLKMPNVNAKRDEVWGYAKFRRYISAAIDSIPPRVFNDFSADVQDRVNDISETELEWFAIYMSHASEVLKQQRRSPRNDSNDALFARLSTFVLG